MGGYERKGKVLALSFQATHRIYGNLKGFINNVCNVIDNLFIHESRVASLQLQYYKSITYIDIHLVMPDFIITILKLTM